MTKEELDLIRELNVSDQEKLQVFKETKFKELDEETNQVRIENTTARIKTLSECIIGCIDDYIQYKQDEEVREREKFNKEMIDDLDLAQISDENRKAFKVS